MKLIAIVVASLFHLAAMRVLDGTEYSREEGGPGLDIKDYELGAEIDRDPDHEIPDDVPAISKMVEGDAFEGDEEMTPEQLAAIGAADGRSDLVNSRQALVQIYTAMKWPEKGGLVYVPYTFQNKYSYTEKERANIAAALEEYEKNTCLRMVARTNEKDYIEIVKANGVCSSSVGRVGGKQTLKLAAGCLYDIGTPFHEFMHAIGYMHEQSRADRDDFVRINWGAIPKAKQHNFKKYEEDTAALQGLPYDTGSVMHYGATAFGTPYGTKTIISKTGATLGQRNGPSKSDIEGINKLYCGGTTTRPVCEDKNNNCPGWAKTYCDDASVLTFMKNNCAKSCNFCGGGKGECTDTPSENAMANGWTCQTYEDYLTTEQLGYYCKKADWKEKQICGKVCAKAGYSTDPDC